MSLSLPSQSVTMVQQTKNINMAGTAFKLLHCFLVSDGISERIFQKYFSIIIFCYIIEDRIFLYRLCNFFIRLNQKIDVIKEGSIITCLLILDLQFDFTFTLSRQLAATISTFQSFNVRTSFFNFKIKYLNYILLWQMRVASFW